MTMTGLFVRVRSTEASAVKRLTLITATVLFGTFQLCGLVGRIIIDEDGIYEPRSQTSAFFFVPDLVIDEIADLVAILFLLLEQCIVAGRNAWICSTTPPAPAPRTSVPRASRRRQPSIISTRR